MTTRADRVARAFDAAQDYDAHAGVQREVARRLAARIAALTLHERPRVLEIGCGTGLLTRALHDTGLRGEWLVTDIAPQMVERARQRLSDLPGLRFATLDGEFGELPDGPFDLVCSSLAVQWFEDAAAALARLATALSPNGHLLATTLGPGSFAQWRAAHEAEGLSGGTPRFAPINAFERLAPMALTIEPVTAHHADAGSFLKGLKAIGAGTPDPAHRPLTPSQLRRVMARFEQCGGIVTYEVVTCHLRSAAL